MLQAAISTFNGDWKITTEDEEVQAVELDCENYNILFSYETFGIDGSQGEYYISISETKDTFDTIFSDRNKNLHECVKHLADFLISLKQLTDLHKE